MFSHLFSNLLNIIINFGTRQKYILAGNVSENINSGTSCLRLLSFTVTGLRRCCITAITGLFALLSSIAMAYVKRHKMEMFLHAVDVLIVKITTSNSINLLRTMCERVFFESEGI